MYKCDNFSKALTGSSKSSSLNYCEKENSFKFIRLSCQSVSNTHAPNKTDK